ncbi:NADH-quinone oxidoreductase subunit NuoE family protein [Parasporobacterium paucivorans]|uniref:NADH-quinone oxidoreductase subunit E n=1 Tax=Parasporobacterium paucivorans DSM 15970 TaxID=1122934 RepID=A0A1M6ETV8_9FIRM|nr:NAD(P)H-dependent oxidoreductase subunit E [Parasporobacterium paucivorans]SHI88806.1 NADH-quinone oxidoreductase subunit E [Parasporobacterium paucivorans DSM 15970]
MNDSIKKHGLTREEKLKIIHSKGADREHVLAILLELQAQSEMNYIDEETAGLVAKEIGISLTHVFDIITFYAMLEDTPQARNLIEVCTSAPCYYTKSGTIIEILERILGIKMGESTPDKQFKLSFTECVGACDIGPVIKIGDEIHGDLDEEKIRQIISNLKAENQ